MSKLSLEEKIDWATVVPTGKKDDGVIRFRVSHEEREAMVFAAQLAGLSLSAWLRQLALRAADLLPEGYS